MRRLILPPALLALLLSGCATLGTNISGDFSCRPPKGDCAPTATIDAKATAELGASDDAQGLELARRRAGVASSDAARTSERTIRIVFPAHVDAAGTLHDEASAWAVIAPPQWKGELRPTERGEPALLKSLRAHLKAAQRDAATSADGIDGAATVDLSPGAAANDPVAVAPADQPLFELASPLPVPSPTDEASAGDPPPAAGGSAPPPTRTLRPLSSNLVYPTAEAIDAAKRAKPVVAAGAKETATISIMVEPRP